MCEDCPQQHFILKPSNPISQPAAGKSDRSFTNRVQPAKRPRRPARADEKSRDKASSPRGLPIEAPRAVISRRAADRLRAGHLWVYRSDIERLVAPVNSSRLIPVFDARGNLLGTALYSSSSQLALRMISNQTLNEDTWIALFRERLHAAIQFRSEMHNGGDSGTNACRLVFSEADFLPGLIADKYNDLVVLQLLSQGMDTAEIRAAFLDVVLAEVKPRVVFERSDPRIQELEELAPASAEPLFVDESRDSPSTSHSTIFQLNGLSFHYDVDSGQKTGAFLDQRENYAAAARYCRGEALDICTYQGGFALHLARTCARVTGVDASRQALEVAERNLEINRDALGNVPMEWIEANAFDLLRDWSASGARFDSIVLDPPAFAKSKRAAEGALRGYKELNLRALKMLRPGGTLVTCSCSHHVGIEEFTSVVAAAAGDARRSVRVLERRGAAADHPVLITVPETEYLKCLICRVE
jgi:23S rRNA (cytosine1962-C5)-methyltransferase